MDCSGTVELTDAVLLAKASSGVDIGLTAQGFRNADLDGNGSLGGKDLSALLRYLAGIDDTL